MRTAALALLASLLACGGAGDLPRAALPRPRSAPPCVVVDPPRLAVVPAANCARLGRPTVPGAVCEERWDGAEPPTTTTKFWAISCPEKITESKEAVR